MTSATTDQIGGLTGSVAVKPPCRVATTANITLSGLQTIDAVTVVEGDRVMVQHQTVTADNGIWVASSGTWQRSADFDGNRDVVKGTRVQVNVGSTQAGWYVVTTADPIVIGTSSIAFQVTADSTIIDVARLSLGNTFAPSASTTIDRQGAGGSLGVLVLKQAGVVIGQFMTTTGGRLVFRGSTVGSGNGWQLSATGQLIEGTGADAYDASTITGPKLVVGTGVWIENGTLMNGKREAFEGPTITFDSVTRAGSTATGIVSAGHGITPFGAYNMAVTDTIVEGYESPSPFKNATVVDSTTITFACSASATSPAAGTVTIRRREPFDPVGAAKNFRDINGLNDHQGVWVGINPTGVLGEKAQSVGALGAKNASGEMNLTLFTHDGPAGVGTKAALCISRVSQNVMIASNVAASDTTTEPQLTARTALSGSIAFRAHTTHATYAATNTQIIVDRAASTAYNFFETKSGGTGGDFEHRLCGDGDIEYDGSASSPAADYAEMFEWEDGNPDGEDRAGLTLVLVGDKVRLSRPDDDPNDVFAVVSIKPTIVGDSPLYWPGKYLKDEFGRPLLEDAETVEWLEPAPFNPEAPENHGSPNLVSYYADAVPEGMVVPPDAIRATHKRKQINPAYDPTQKYVLRKDRKEWVYAGALGKLAVRGGQVVNPRWRLLKKVSETVALYWVN